MLRFVIPLIVFILLVILLSVGLQKDPRLVPSPLIGKPAPAFELPVLGAPERTVSQQQMLGKVWLLNVWASWCVACRSEHPLMNDLASLNLVDIIGLNYKDAPADAQKWLDHLGNPYQASVMDSNGRVGIDWGVYGVPETFLVDKKGIIRFKQIGPVTQEVLQDSMIPMIKQLQAE
jgi:cytochrome c biogenesis protein CcmG/thiol:disulfide interchange protein DsbE